MKVYTFLQVLQGKSGEGVDIYTIITEKTVVKVYIFTKVLQRKSGEAIDIYKGVKEKEL